MKLRQKPEDFIVEEINDLKVNTSGKFALYSLKKANIETFYLLSYLARKNYIKSNLIGIAGMKDKHAITTQFLTVPFNIRLKTQQEKNFQLRFLGYVDKELKTGDLIGNRFTLIVRDLREKDLKRLEDNINAVKEYGVPNYFDSQRFGSVHNKEFIAKKVIIREYGEAVKIYLTHYTKSEPKARKDDKREIEKYWNDLSKADIKNLEFRDIVGAYIATNDWLIAYKKIPTKLRQFFISAYQSYLWNESVKEIFRQISKEGIYSVKYNIGALLFFKRLTSYQLNLIPQSVHMLSENVRLTGIEERVTKIILQKEGISLDDFKNMNLTGMNFQCPVRKVIVRPFDVSFSDPEIDEMNDKGKGNRFKVKLSFSLPKGSYATILIKRLFNK